MFPGIFLEHHERLQPGLPDHRVGPGNEIGHEKQGHQIEQFGFSFIVADSFMEPSASVQYDMPVNAGQLPDQFPDVGIIFQPVVEMADQAGGKRALGTVRQLVVHPQPVFLIGDQSGILQDFEVLAGGGLGFVQGGLDFTYAHGFVLKYFL